MLFRVWNKKNNCYTKEPIRINSNGNVFYQELRSFSYDAPWYMSDDYEIEFNTGITLADGTETFYDDIIRYDDGNYHGQKDRDGYVYAVLTKNFQLNEIDYMINIDKECFYDNVELVGNIHETELTDAMKVWIKE